MYRAASLAALLLAGCAAPGPAVRHAVALLDQVDAVSEARERALRAALHAAWRDLAIAEHDAALRATDLTHDAAMTQLRATLDVLDRAREVIDGYAQESAASRAQARHVRDAVTAALVEMERRSAALDQLSEAASAAAGQLGEMRGARAPRAEEVTDEPR